MKYIILFLWLFISRPLASDIYHSLRVYEFSEITLSILQQEGIPLDHVRIKQGTYIDVIANEEQTIRLSEQNVLFDILINDLTQHFIDNNVPEVRRDFELGSMLGNYTLDEVLSKLDSLAIIYPNLVSAKDSIGTSVEGRTIWSFKVSDNPNVDEDEPQVLYTGLTHAREPLSMMNQLYFVEWLCENYESNPVASFLIDEREMVFIPVINPDGYVYNESIAPNGGGMHRKNRLDTGCGNGTQRGVDLNRNYGYEWGADDSGSSPNPCSSTFRGDLAFSEPETQAVRDFILAHNFSNVLHYHSYSNVLIHSWGNNTLPDEPDLTTIREIGWEMSRYNGYEVGTGYETIGYGVNGDAVDWSYGDAGLIAYTPEVGSYQDNFWPPENRVIPLCEDQLYSNQIFSFVAGPDHVIYESQMIEQVNDTIHFNVTVQNRGLLPSDGDVIATVATYINTSSIVERDENIGELNEREDIDIPVSILVPEDLPDGTQVGFVITLSDNSSFVRSDTIKTLTGAPVSIFVEDAEDELAQWETNNWGISSTNAYSGDYSITDSPQGNYQNNTTSSISTSIPINLTGLLAPAVYYAAKWHVENNYDFVRFQISDDNIYWNTLEGSYTEQGVNQGTQDPDEHGYDGTSDWVEEFIDLSDYSDESSVYFRFLLTSDGGVTGDGFYFDDFSVSGYLNYLPGDMDENGELNIFDVLTIVDITLMDDNPNEYQHQRADVNFDGSVNIYDVLSLVDTIIAH